jgi:hypothetical protein
MRRRDCHNAIKQVKDRFETALQIVNVLIGMVIEQPELLYTHHLNLAEMRALAAELEDLYFTRMFACFESGLRHFWRTTIRNTKPRTEHLITSIAARVGVPQDTLDTVQEIRNFRNYLIHEEHEVQKRFTMDEASGPLNTYLARLPLEW